MRILHVSSARTYGGGERHFVDLTRGLVERGHDVFVALRPTCMWRYRLDLLPKDHIFKVSIRNSFGVLSALRLADLIREYKIDIVHAHVARDYIPASIACLASRARFVLTRHVLFPLKPFNRFALKNVSMAIGVSDAVGEMLRDIFPPKKVVVIPNGISVDVRSDGERRRLRDEFRADHAIPPDVPLIGTLGELKELKGQRDLVLAAAEIVKRVPDCRFVIAGEDHSASKAYRREIRRLARVLGLENRFVWLAWLEDIQTLYAALDLFVSPSHSESFGLAMLEAMSLGTPVVATETEGAKLLVGKDGVTVPIEDPVKLAEKIVTLLNDPDRRSRLAKQMRERAATEFSLRDMIDRTEKVYRQVTEKEITAIHAAK